MSYSPSVQKASLTVAPHFFAISLKASVRFGESLTLRIPWSVKRASGFRFARLVERVNSTFWSAYRSRKRMLLTSGSNCGAKLERQFKSGTRRICKVWLGSDL
jgi:hypothetical protein